MGDPKARVRDPEARLERLFFWFVFVPMCVGFVVLVGGFIYLLIDFRQ